MTNLLLIASPKKIGNSASIAEYLLQYIEAEQIFLKDYAINSCIDCGYCNTHIGLCSQDFSDDCKYIYDKILQSKNIILISPIYFYHAPSHVKALIDRSQRFWKNSQKEKIRNIYAIFVAARKQGENIAKGYELTLKYFAPLINGDYKNSSTLYDLEKANDFKNSIQSQKFIQDFIKKILS